MSKTENFIYFSTRGACWHSFGSCRYAIVFTRNVGVWLFACCGWGGGVDRPKIGTRRHFGRPRDIAGLLIERISNKNHGRNQHDDCNGQHNALKIKGTQKGFRLRCGAVHGWMQRDVAKLNEKYILCCYYIIHQSEINSFDTIQY